MSRTLHFQQITDSRFMDRKKCLPVLNDRIQKIKELLNIENVTVEIGKPYLLEWGDKTKEEKGRDGYDTDNYNIQYRANFRVKKYTRKVTWNDIFELVNSVKAVPYNFK